MAQYTDIDLNVSKKHPITNDIGRLQDQACVKNSIKNLILTKVRTIPHKREKGSNIYGAIGELNVAILHYEIQSEIEFIISQYEPRAKLLDVVVNGEENSLSIRIIFAMNNGSSDTPIALDLALNR